MNKDSISKDAPMPEDNSSGKKKKIIVIGSILTIIAVVVLGICAYTECNRAIENMKNQAAN